MTPRSLPSAAPDPEAPARESPAWLRYGWPALLHTGGGCWLILGALAPSLAVTHGLFSPDSSSIALIAAIALLAVVGGIAALAALAELATLMARLDPGPRFGLFLVLVLAAASLTGWWYGWMREDDWRRASFAEPARHAAWSLAVLCMTSGWSWLSARGSWRVMLAGVAGLKRWRWRGLGGLAMLMGLALIARFALDGMPHTAEGLTYLYQGRMLMHGALVVDVCDATLFDGILLLNQTPSGDYIGRFSPGWPLVLGLFDAVKLGWLANPLIAAALALATGAYARRRGGVTLGNLTLLTMLLCGWLWWNAAGHLPQLAVALGLLGFVWAFQEASEKRSPGFGLLAGLALGAVIMMRPQDAAFFAPPAIVLATWRTLRQPISLGPAMGAIVVGVSPAILGYLWINQATMGGIFETSYAATVRSQLASQAASSPLEFLVWTHESLAAVSRSWLTFTWPITAAVAMGVWLGWRELRGMWLLPLSAASLSLGYGGYIVTTEPWMGPAWLAPIIPAIALVIAAGLRGSLRQAPMPRAVGVLPAEGRRHRRGPLRMGQTEARADMAHWHLRAVVTAVLTSVLFALPVRLVELNWRPPHRVDRQVLRAAGQIPPSIPAVIALPVDHDDPSAVTMHPRAGAFLMQYPLGRTRILFVREAPGWEEQARICWPHRVLWRLHPDPDVVKFVPVSEAAEPVVAPPSPTNADLQEPAP